MRDELLDREIFTTFCEARGRHYSDSGQVRRPGLLDPLHRLTGGVSAPYTVWTSGLFGTFVGTPEAERLSQISRSCGLSAELRSKQIL